MKEIYTEIIINSSPEKVWEILTDFEKYQNWNPFIKSIKGKPIKGNSIVAMIIPPDSKGMKFNPIITEIIENQELKWLGKLFIKGLFDGEHRFRIEKIGERKIKFIQSEIMSGLLVAFFSGELKKAKKGFKLMNEALKRRAEI